MFKIRERLERAFSGLFNVSAIRSRYLDRHVSDFGRIVGHRRLVLDVGSGSSPYKEAFAREIYVSMDIDSQSNVDIIGDVCCLPFKGDTADVIVLTEVLEHVRDTREGFRELNRVLSQGGYLVLTIPLLWGIHDRVDYYRWTDAGLKVQLAEYGFDVLKLENSGGIFNCLGEMLRQIPYQLFGPYSPASRNWLKYGLVFLSFLWLIPVVGLLRALDRFDTKKNFTLGYSVLAQRTSAAPQRDDD